MQEPHSITEDKAHIEPISLTAAPVEKQESLWELIRFAIIVLIIALGLRFFVAQPFVVSGTSMVPTFQDKNYLIVDELTYRFSEPSRGDVIVFHPPGQPKGVYYIKRIIGLPGETIKISNGVVTIVNKENPNGLVLTEPYISAVTSGNINKTLSSTDYFVMGDNRPYSSDSRMWGTLPKANIVGRALLRLYPLNEINALPGVHHTYSAQ
jgi:signal peptidase I